MSLPKDCSDLVVPSRRSGSYKIYPYGVQHLPVSVYCEFDGKDSWTVYESMLAFITEFNIL